MGVVPVAAGIGHPELVVEILPWLDWQLRHIRHAIHFQRQADAMPVDGGLDRQVVDEAHAQPGTLPHAQLGPRGTGPERPGLSRVSRDQFDVKGRCDQLVVMAGIVIFDLAQPVPRGAPRAQANHNQAGQALEHLSTGEGHRSGYLVFGTNSSPAGADEEGRIRYTCEWERLSEGSIRCVLGALNRLERAPVHSRPNQWRSSTPGARVAANSSAGSGATPNACRREAAAG